MKTKKRYHKHYSKGLTTKRGGKCRLLKTVYGTSKEPAQAGMNWDRILGIANV